MEQEVRMWVDASLCFFPIVYTLFPLKQFILSRAFNSGFSLDLMVKDLTTAVDLARETSTPAVFSAACRELWAAALSRLESEADHTAVLRWFEEMAEAQLGEV